MTLNDPEQTTSPTGESTSAYICPYLPSFVWKLDDKATSSITIGVVCLACPVTILLNTLVILAIRKTKKLRNNSNFLLSSLAVSDLLVGVVCQPVYVIERALYLNSQFRAMCICALITRLVTFATCAASLHHLVLVAWERYVAITKCMRYRTIVTKGRLKKYILVAWLSAVLPVLPVLMELDFVDYDNANAIDLYITGLPVFIFVVLIIYFYVMIYVEVRKRQGNQLNQVINAQSRNAKLEKKVSITTALLTVVLLILYSPNFVFFFLAGGAYPVLRESSFFMWAMTLTQINSLLNPLLYFYRNPRLRNAALELLRIRKPTEGQISGGALRNVKQENAVVEQPIHIEGRARSWGPGTSMFHSSLAITLQRCKTAPASLGKDNPSNKELPKYFGGLKNLQESSLETASADDVRYKPESLKRCKRAKPRLNSW